MIPPSRSQNLQATDSLRGIIVAQRDGRINRLTHRELEVLSWVAQGKANWEIGKILNLSSGTVRKHLQHIYSKLGVENRTAAALCLLEIVQSSSEVLNFFSSENNPSANKIHAQRR